WHPKRAGSATPPASQCHPAETNSLLGMVNQILEGRHANKVAGIQQRMETLADELAATQAELFNVRPTIQVDRTLDVIGQGNQAFAAMDLADFPEAKPALNAALAAGDTEAITEIVNQVSDAE
ncbi:hypothetical protein NG895_24445, partial [Aeoliella sp. ICT_H6.2]